MTKNASATNRLVLLLAGAVALCMAVVVWLANPREGRAVATPPSSASSKVAAARDDLTSPVPREDVPSPSRTKATPQRMPEPPEVASSKATYEVRFSLERPDRAPIVVPQADIEVVLSDGTQRHATATSGSRTSMRLPSGPCTVRVHADGFVHHVQLVLVESDRRERGHPDDDPQDERLVLWAVGKEWVAVVVQTNDGRPFRTLAEDLGLEPKRFFYQSFDMRVQLSPPGQGVPFEPARGPEHVATFHRPPEYKSFEFASGVAGQLELEHDPPMWAQLLLFGAPLGVEVIHPGDREVVFHLDQAAFDSCCSRVKLRVLDAHTHAPITDAKVTLRADTAPHRRTDQENVRPEWDGSVEFPRVMPGKYELTVTHGDDLDQRRIELVAKQVLEVGDVLLEQRGHLDLLVVDEGDHPASAWIEIAPFEPGKRVDELYPPMLHRQSGTDGKYRLPLPTKRSIVRARIEGGTSNGQPAQGARSANLLIDPDKLPPQPWKIVLRDPVSTSFQVGLRDVTTVEVQDELGIVDTWPHFDAQGKATCDLVPGRHKARYLDASKSVRNEQDFVVAKDSGLVHGP